MNEIMKKCSGPCGLEKLLEAFHKNKSSKDGHTNICKECKNKYDKERYPKIRENKIEKSKIWYENNIEKKKEYDKTYIENNKETKKEYDREYREKNQKEIKVKRQKYYIDNKEKFALYRKTNQDHINHLRRDRREKNKEKAREQNNRYNEKRKKIDIEYKLRTQISQTISIYVKAEQKDFPTWTKLPYSPQQLKEHLESLFESWMTWENHGRTATELQKTWQIDHIIPQSKLPYDSLEHPNFLKCWALENLRPYDSWLNAKKRNKLI